MKFYKWIAVFLTIVLLCGWVYLVSDINNAFPSPENIECRVADSIDYLGLTLTPKYMQIYTYDNFIKEYGEGMQSYPEEDSRYTYFVATVHVKNNIEEKVMIKTNPLENIMLELGINANGIYYDAIEQVDYSGNVYNRNFNRDIQLPFRILTEYLDGMSASEMRKEGIKLVLSYYPDKVYLMYQKK